MKQLHKTKRMLEGHDAWLFLTFYIKHEQIIKITSVIIIVTTFIIRSGNIIDNRISVNSRCRMY